MICGPSPDPRLAPGFGFALICAGDPEYGLVSYHFSNPRLRPPTFAADFGPRRWPQTFALVVAPILPRTLVLITLRAYHFYAYSPPPSLLHRSNFDPAKIDPHSGGVNPNLSHSAILDCDCQMSFHSFIHSLSESINLLLVVLDAIR